jgi:hypothetical protein
MKAEVLGFGEIELDGERYDHDIVIEAGEVKKRKKGVSLSGRIRTHPTVGGGGPPLGREAIDCWYWRVWKTADHAGRRGRGEAPWD